MSRLPLLLIGDPTMVAEGAAELARAYFSIATRVKPESIHLLGLEKAPSIAQLRALTARLMWKPFHADEELIVILRADELSLPAANALLKFLEEPSESTLILLQASSESLLPTIRSRVSVQFLKSTRIFPDLITVVTKPRRERMKIIEPYLDDSQLLDQLMTHWLSEIEPLLPARAAVRVGRLLCGILPILKTPANKKMVFEYLMCELPQSLT